MIAASLAIYAELLTRAASEPFGLSIRTTNAKRLQVCFGNYQRETFGTSRDHDVRACLTPDPSVVFLVKRSVELP